MLADEMASVWPDWKIIEPEIGHGAYGRVYKIKRSNAGFGEVEYQALKVISIPLDEDDIDILTLGQSERESKELYYHSVAEKMAKEASFMSDLQGNPYIVKFDKHAIVPRGDGKAGWDILIRMELLTSFKQHMAEHGFTRQDVIRLGIDICKALEFCRKKDVIHRDIKPENIFISDVGNYKLGDFGVAVNADKTLGGLSKKGTYAYMAPEVYKGQAYGPSIDVYSLGIILYRLLNGGREPFMSQKGIAETYEERERALSKRMQCEPLPYPENDTGKLAEIVMKAAAPFPEDRYHTPVEMRFDLETLIDKRDDELMILPMAGGGSFFPTVPRTEPVSISQNPVTLEPVKKEEKKPEPKKNNRAAIVCCMAAVIGILAFIMLKPAPKAESIDIGVGAESVIDGDSCNMDYQILPKRAKSDITWSSSNEAIATIDEKGVLNAHTAGVVTITAELENGVSASCDVTIRSKDTTIYEGVDYADVYDYAFYTAVYPDIAKQYAGNPDGALKYFVEEGIAQGHRAISGFSVVGYAWAYSDLRDMYGNDLPAYVQHFIKYGKKEGRNGLGAGKLENYATVYEGFDYRDVYDYNYYIAYNEDVFKQFNVDDKQVLEYFVTNGMVQGQQGCESFNPVCYAFEHADVRERCHHNLDYYVKQGEFDYTPYYLDYINVGKAAGYHAVGQNKMRDYATIYKGKDYAKVYDYNIYYSNNMDIFALVGVDDLAALEHFVKYGKDEGRTASD